MSHTIKILKDDQLVLAQIWGQMDNEAFTQYIDQTESFGQFPDSYRLLLVIDPNTDFKVETQVIRDLSRRARVFGINSARVIVASSSLGFGLSRLYSLAAPTAGDQYTVVRSIDEAAEILALEVPIIEANLA
jgi:hypothetical protein